MSIQGFGGVCPCCDYDRMWVRYGAEGYFQFEACPNCGFAFGKWSELEGNQWAPKSGINNEIWEAIEIMEGTTRYQAFQNSLNKKERELITGKSWEYAAEEITKIKLDLAQEQNVRYDLG